MYETHGDLGDAALLLKSRIQTLFASPPLKASQVFNNLCQLSRLKGQGSQKLKANVIKKLLKMLI